jgi:hypothetical protein
MWEFVRGRRKRHDEDDWQRQLQAEPSLVLVSEEERARQLGQEVAGRRLRRSLHAFAGLLFAGAVVFVAADPHKVYAKYLVALGPVALLLGHLAITVVGVMSSQRRARRRLELGLGEAPLDVLLRRLLYSFEQDCKGFLADPPQRRAYADWLASGTERLQKLSPDIATDWAKPDPSDRLTGRNVSKPELEARARRIADLRRTVMDYWNPHARSPRERVRGQVRALEAGRSVRRG